jgi:hypothetical protein
VGNMAVAYFMVHAPRGFFPLLNGGELAIVYCFVFLYFWFAGGRAEPRSTAPTRMRIRLIAEPGLSTAAAVLGFPIAGRPFDRLWRFAQPWWALKPRVPRRGRLRTTSTCRPPRIRRRPPAALPRLSHCTLGSGPIIPLGCPE